MRHSLSSKSVMALTKCCYTQQLIPGAKSRGTRQRPNVEDAQGSRGRANISRLFWFLCFPFNSHIVSTQKDRFEMIYSWQFCLCPCESVVLGKPEQQIHYSIHGRFPFFSSSTGSLVTVFCDDSDLVFCYIMLKTSQHVRDKHLSRSAHSSINTR